MRNLEYPLYGLLVSIAVIAFIAVIGSNQSTAGISSSGVSAQSDNSPGQAVNKHNCGDTGENSPGDRGCTPHTPTPTTECGDGYGQNSPGKRGCHATPTAIPTAVPTTVPTAVPTAVPTTVPTVEPTAVPTTVPPPYVPPSVRPAPPAPDGFTVTASASGTQFVFNWTPLSGANRYRLQRYDSSTQRWSTFYTTTATTFYSRHYLTGCQTQEYRIAARGNGRTYSAEWSDYSDGVSVRTTACNAPQFGASTYRSTLQEDAYVGDAVASALATNLAGTTISYSITGGNNAGQFAIDSSSGAITVAGLLDYETTRSHVLTVQATGSTGATATAAVTVTVTDVFESTVRLDIAEPLLGQTVTLTAQTDAPTGQTVSYQWEEFSSTRWTSSGGATTTAEKEVTFNTATTKSYRVVASYGTNSATSAPVRVEWRALGVNIGVDDSVPDAGDTVIMTALTDAPTGFALTYQWEEKSSGVWADVSNGTSKRKSVRKDERGVREFKVTVGYGSLSAVSPSAFLVWDEYEIVDEMVTALTGRVTASSGYRTAQTTFLTCVNRGRPTASQYGSFGLVLADYVAVETKIDSCGTSMFSAIRSSFRTNLSSLKTGNPTYAALLRTPQGRAFEGSVGNTSKLKQQAKLMSRLFAADAAAAAGSGGETSNGSRNPDTVTDYEDCIPDSDEAPVSMADRFEALNCLVFDQGHKFWLGLQKSATLRNAFKTAIDDSEMPWLDYQNFICDNVFGPVNFPDPSGVAPCLKHDVAYGTLQHIVPEAQGLEGTTMDAAWSPRNKYLADLLFLIDGECGMKAGQERRECIPGATNPNELLDAITVTAWFLLGNHQSIGEALNPRVQHAAVAYGNSKLWPITQPDVDHAQANQNYLDCPAPGLAGTPTVSYSGQSFWLRWQPSNGCASINSTYEFCFSVKYEGDDRIADHCQDYRVTPRHTGEQLVSVSRVYSEWIAVRLVSLEVTPQHRVYPLWVSGYPTVSYGSARWVYTGGNGGD